MLTHRLSRSLQAGMQLAIKPIVHYKTPLCVEDCMFCVVAKPFSCCICLQTLSVVFVFVVLNSSRPSKTITLSTAFIQAVHLYFLVGLHLYFTQAIKCIITFIITIINITHPSINNTMLITTTSTITLPMSFANIFFKANATTETGNYLLFLNILCVLCYMFRR